MEEIWGFIQQHQVESIMVLFGAIASFSANANGKYTDVAYSEKLEALLPDSAKHAISKKTLRKYEGCMNGQYKYAKKKATKALVGVLKGAN